jgi:hypothetical protein
MKRAHFPVHADFRHKKIPAVNGREFEAAYEPV